MKLNNKYYIMRHGQAISNIKEVCSSWPEKFRNPLTKLGKETIKESAEKLVGKDIDIIFASPLLRTKQTAEIVGKVLNSNSKFDKSSTTFKKIKVVLDKRLREVGFGIFNYSLLESMWKSFKREEERIKQKPSKGENYEEILKRMMNFLKDTDKKYENRNILIISHEGPLFLIQGKVMGLSIKETIKKFPLNKRIHKGEIKELN